MMNSHNCRCICHQGFNEPKASHVVPCCDTPAYGPLPKYSLDTGYTDWGKRLIRAAQFAADSHKGQMRKYTKVPYITHPARIASTLMMKGASPALVVAAWLHDVVEDCGVALESLEPEFGDRVLYLTWCMTNPSKKMTDATRAERKEADRRHWAAITDEEAHWLKAEDRLDNLRDLWNDGRAPKDWQEKYALESNALVKVLTLAPKDVRLDCYNIIDQILGISE
jgi:(p)ppGpp synthase/HD superfamily hydrolase